MDYAIQVPGGTWYITSMPDETDVEVVKTAAQNDALSFHPNWTAIRVYANAITKAVPNPNPFVWS